LRFNKDPNEFKVVEVNT